MHYITFEVVNIEYDDSNECPIFSPINYSSFFPKVYFYVIAQLNDNFLFELRDGQLIVMRI